MDNATKFQNLEVRQDCSGDGRDRSPLSAQPENDSPKDA